LIDVECCKDDPEDIQLVSEDFHFNFKPVSGQPTLRKGAKFLLGLRPEHISLTENGTIKSKVYSTLPSGMETIVIIRIKETYLTSVVFGGLDFKVDSEIGMSLSSDNYFLFDKISGSLIAAGSLSVDQKNSGEP
jgi:multiple sugar transport system ATP-binding protein